MRLLLGGKRQTPGLLVAGLEVPPQCDGLSLAPMLRQEGCWREPPPYWRTAAHFEFDFRGDAAHMGLNPHEANLAVLRTERYKYVRKRAKPPRTIVWHLGLRLTYFFLCKTKATDINGRASFARFTLARSVSLSLIHI